MKEFLKLLLKWAAVIIVATFIQCILYTFAAFCIEVADLDLRNAVAAITSIWIYSLMVRMEKDL